MGYAPAQSNACEFIVVSREFIVVSQCPPGIERQWQQEHGLGIVISRMPMFQKEHSDTDHTVLCLRSQVDVF